MTYLLINYYFHILLLDSIIFSWFLTKKKHKRQKTKISVFFKTFKFSESMIFHNFFINWLNFDLEHKLAELWPGKEYFFPSKYSSMIFLNVSHRQKKIAVIWEILAKISRGGKLSLSLVFHVD